MGIIRSEAGISSNYRINNGDWWLKDPYDPDAVLQFNPLEVGDGGLLFTNKMQTTIYNPINRRYPVIVTDEIQGFASEITWFFSNAEASYGRLVYLHSLQRAMLLQSGWLASKWYIYFVDDWREKIVNADPWVREVTLKFVQVERPTAALL